MAWFHGFNVGHYMVAEELVRAHVAELRARQRRRPYHKKWKERHIPTSRRTISQRLFGLVRGS
jgi:hypothetical protein